MLLTLASLLAPVALQAELPRELPPREAWRVVSLAEDAGLDAASTFGIDFESDGTAWLAASDGLYRYDGHAWTRFTTAEGLPGDYVRCVTVARDGTLWVGTDRGAGVWDGRQMRVPADAGALEGASVRRIVEEPGGTLWFCCDRWPDPRARGRLVRYRDGTWRSFDEEDGLPSSYVQDVVLDRRGRRFVLTNAGLALMRGERFTRPWHEAGLPYAGTWVWDLVDAPELGVVVSTNAGIVIETDTGWERVLDPPGQNTKLGLTRAGEVVTCLPDPPNAFLRFDGLRFVPLTEPVGAQVRAVEMLREAPDGALWAVGLGAVLRWERDASEWTVHADVPPLAFATESGDVWFADAERVVRRRQGAWERIEDAAAPLVRAPDESVWMRTGDGVAHFREGLLVRHDTRRLGVAEAQELVVAGDGSVWVVGRREEPLLRLDDEWSALAWPPGSTTSLRSVTADAGGRLWTVQQGPDARNRLLWVDVRGAGEAELPPWAVLEPALDVEAAPSGTLWIFGFFGLAERPPGGEAFERVTGYEGGHVFNVLERGDELWVATTSSTGGRNAISVRRGGAWVHRPTAAWWLAGTGSDREVLYSTPRGLLRVPPGGDRPILLRLPREEKVQAAATTPAGDVWIQGADRTYHYRPDGVPPRTFLESVPEHLTEGEDLVVQLAAVERFRPRAEGAHGHVEISLDGGPWTLLGAVGEGRLRVSRPGVGRHVVAVRTRDPGLDVESFPARVAFQVHPLPVQSRPWFQWAVATVVVVIAVLGAVAFAAWRRAGRQAALLEELVEQRSAALGLSERRYQELFDQSREAILVLNSARRVVEANPAAERVLGREDLPGRGLEDLFDAPTSTGGDDFSRAFGQSLMQDAEVEVDVVPRGGLPRNLVVRAQRLRDQDDSSQGFLVLLRDVTDRRLVEERVRDAHKMEAVGRLAAGVAHEFNNLLSVLVGHAELLIRSLGDDPARLDSVRTILEQSRRARAITSQIQGFSRDSVLERRVVDLDVVVGDVLLLLEAAIGEKVRLEVDLDSAGACVFADPLQLEQVLINLVLNARDASERGTIHVRTRRRRGHAELDVSDEGVGMDEATRRRIFEPFFTTKPPGKGTGLGLAIVHDVVEQLGGEIVVASRLGHGSTFRVRLPLAAGEPAVEAVTPALPAEQRQGRVLVVEDEPPLAALLQRVLEEAGYDVGLAGTAAEAEALAKAHAYDLVVSDIGLPDVSGEILTERLRERHPGLRAVLMTGYAGGSHQDGAGRQPVLAKPFSFAELLGLVRRELDQA